MQKARAGEATWGRCVRMPERATSLVLLVAPQLDEYRAQIIAGVRSVLQPAGASLLVHLQARPDVGLPQSLRRILRHAHPHGVILTPSTDVAQEAELNEKVWRLGMPAVAIAYNSFPGMCVRGDNVSGMSALLCHLLDDCKIRHPVLVRGISDQADSVEREGIFRKEMGRRGIPVDEELVVEGGFWHETTYGVMRDLLTRRRDMDAVIALNDLSAFGALRALRGVGLRVPDDVRLTGFDNAMLSFSTLPGLTTVDQDIAGQGKFAATHLLSAMADVRLTRNIVVPSRLVVRGSTRPAGLRDAASVDVLTDMARAAETRLAELEAIASLSRSLANARTLDDLLSALTVCLGWLELDRFFLTVHEPDDTTSSDAHEGEGEIRTRLVLDYRDGRVTLPPVGEFPANQMLPAALLSELESGALAMQPIEMAGREIGCMLFDRSRGTTMTSEIFQVNISRTLDAIFSAKKLGDHAADLERLIALRTQELEVEVTTRRRAELQLQRANAELHRLAMVDGLTHIANRTAFEQHLTRHWELVSRYGRDICVVMVDVDFFKAFNDQYGHVVGDDALRTVATCLDRAVSGPDDLTSRYGGEEFVAVLPGSDLSAATAAAERFQELLAQAAIPHAASAVALIVTVSVGIATRSAADGSPTGLMAAADEALYRAKSSGRNCIRVTDRARPRPVGLDGPPAGDAGPADPPVPAPRRTSGASSRSRITPRAGSG